MYGDVLVDSYGYKTGNYTIERLATLLGDELEEIEKKAGQAGYQEGYWDGDHDAREN